MRYGPMKALGIFLGIQRSHGRNHVAITGSAGINGMKMSTSRVLAVMTMVRAGLRVSDAGDYKPVWFVIGCKQAITLRAA